jgi:hypothetical protein
MTSSDNPRIREIRGIRDPLARARESQALIERGRQTITEAQEIRDEAIREVRGKLGSRKTIDEIAQYIGAKRNVVVDALRGKRMTS